MKRHQVTILDIARELKISKSTVSRALIGHPDVNSATKNAVLEVANRLEYQRNLLALSLINNQTNILGVVIPDIERPFFASLISGVQRAASKAGYKVMICQSDESYSTEVSNVQALVSTRVDGLLICHSKETTDYEHVKALYRKKIPLVFFDRVCEEVDASKVILDDVGGAAMVVDHLISTGCKNIAILTGPEHLPICKNRLQGYVNAHEKHHRPVNESLVVQCNFDKERIAEATNHLMDVVPRPDAIFVIYDGGAIEAMVTLKERGIKIPDEVSVAAIGDSPVGRIIEPSLTTVSQYPFEMGKLAAQMFLEQVNSDAETYVPRVEVLKPQLIVRKSTKPLPSSLK